MKFLLIFPVCNIFLLLCDILKMILVYILVKSFSYFLYILKNVILYFCNIFLILFTRFKCTFFVTFLQSFYNNQMMLLFHFAYCFCQCCNKYCHVRIHHTIIEIPINFTFQSDIAHIIKRAFEKKDIKALQSFLTQIFCYKLRSKEFQWIGTYIKRNKKQNIKKKRRKKDNLDINS